MGFRSRLLRAAHFGRSLQMIPEILRKLTRVRFTRRAVRPLVQLYGTRIGWPLSCGYRIILDRPTEWMQGTILVQRVFEPAVVSILMRLLDPGDLFFDVGANMGHHTLVAASRGAVVHAFEPVPRLVRRIRDNIRLNKLACDIRVLETAVASENGFAILHISQRSDDGSHSLIEGVPSRSVTSITVQTMTLDRYLHDHACGVPDVVKLDVEGSEAAVLDGARTLLEAPSPPAFVLETGDRLADKVGESAARVLARLAYYRYRMFRIQEPEGTLTEVTPSTVDGELANYMCIHEASPRLGRFIRPDCPYDTRQTIGPPERRRSRVSISAEHP
jgi:FkbM family methyltransferase